MLSLCFSRLTVGDVPSSVHRIFTPQFQGPKFITPLPTLPDRLPYRFYATIFRDPEQDHIGIVRESICFRILLSMTFSYEHTAKYFTRNYNMIYCFCCNSTYKLILATSRFNVLKIIRLSLQNNRPFFLRGIDYNYILLTYMSLQNYLTI